MKWKPLSAVLLGLLMVGVTAGSISAMPYGGNASIRIKHLQYPTGRSTIYLTMTKNNVSSHYKSVLPYQPMMFFDKEQVALIFDRAESYSYQGIVYLAFKWEADIGYNSVSNAGTPDKVVILIPWETKKDHWILSERNTLVSTNTG